MGTKPCDLWDTTIASSRPDAPMARMISGGRKCRRIAPATTAGTLTLESDRIITRRDDRGPTVGRRHLVRGVTPEEPKPDAHNRPSCLCQKPDVRNRRVEPDALIPALSAFRPRPVLSSGIVASDCGPSAYAGLELSPANNSAPSSDIVRTSRLRSKNRFRRSQLVSEIKRQLWHAAPCVARSPLRSSGSWSAQTRFMVCARLARAAV